MMQTEMTYPTFLICVHPPDPLHLRSIFRNTIQQAKTPPEFISSGVHAKLI
jgi:hypothetical protein